MVDARQWWDRALRNPIAQSDSVPSEFTLEVAAGLEYPSQILELGCGRGEDSRHFARAGHRVIASDFVRQPDGWESHVRSAGDGLRFVLLDMRDRLPFRDAAFDVVYARLSLHYFSNEETRRIFDEIHRVLTPNGLLAFLCKSTRDPLYGQGEPVGPGMFRLNGKVRHFFDEDFARACAGDSFRFQRFCAKAIVSADGPSHVLGALTRSVAPGHG